MTPSPLHDVESYPEPEPETVLVDLSYTSMLTLPPGEKKSLLARFKEFMDPQERTPNVLRKPRPDQPNVKRSLSVRGEGVKSGKERFGGLSRLRTSFSGSKAQAEDADTPTAPLEAERSDSTKQKRSSWFHRSKSSRDRETPEADQRTSQTPQEGDPPLTRSQSTPHTTTLSRTLSAPIQPPRLSIRNAFPPRRRPQTPLRSTTQSAESTLSDRDLDKWARNGDRVRNSHFIPPFQDPVVPAPWTAGEQTIPSVPGPLQVRLQARRQPSRGDLQNSGRDRRPVSQPPLDPSSSLVGPANGTEPFPSFQQPSDLDFDASRGQNHAWVESPAPEETETYSSDPSYYTSPFSVPRPVSCPQPGSSDPATATTPQRARPLSPSREASIAAGEAIAQEGEKYVAYRPPPIPVPVPSFEARMQQGHDYTAAATERRLADNSVVEFDAGPENTLLTSHTYLEATSPPLIAETSSGETEQPPSPPPKATTGPATLTPVPSIEIPSQHGHDYTAAHQPPADLSVAELDASPATTIPTRHTYGVVEFAEELRGDRRRGSSEYSEEAEPAASLTGNAAAGPAPLMPWQQRAESRIVHDTDPSEELLDWAGTQPSVLYQLSYQRTMGSQSPFPDENREHGSPPVSGRDKEAPLATRPSTDPAGSLMLEKAGSAAEAQSGTRPVESDRASSPVPVLYFTTVPPTIRSHSR
ncbi:hypothetical protein LTR56_023444 [Elasticomyces elasticus]|nr:hypothetical protein LTR56_023444 [Elasticomyces elasticus]KAK3625709.1 hypothetical protein LTR22_023454 [Elasticomyces elasticus]KAK4919743.1 hypothetical protein LTR49_012646 [Elasticomyces elasticus]KAK5758436.1 hypothetical protein LTS12_011458 [Elasticomyces elasticus]